MERKEIEEMSSLELLQELVAANRKNEKIRLIKTIVLSLLAIVVIYFLGTTLYRIYGLLNDYQESIQTISQNLDQFQNYFDSDGVETIEGLNEFLQQIEEFKNGFGSFFGN